MRGLQPLIEFMERYLPGSVQLLHDVASTTGVFKGGGAHGAIIYSKLSICVPDEIYRPVRIAWYGDRVPGTKRLPPAVPGHPGLFGDAADRTVHASRPDTLVGCYFGDGSAFNGEWNVHLSLAFTPADLALIQEWLACIGVPTGAFSTGASHVGGAGVLLGPFLSTLVPRPGCTRVTIGHAAYNVGGPVVRTGRDGAWVCLAIRMLFEMLESVLYTRGPVTLHNVLFPAETVALMAAYRFRCQLPLSFQLGVVDQQGGFGGRYPQAQIIAAFFAGHSQHRYLSSLMLLRSSALSALPLARSSLFAGLAQRCLGRVRTGPSGRQYADGGQPLPLPHKVTIGPATPRTEYTLHSDTACEALQVYLVNEHLLCPQHSALRGIMHFTYTTPPSTDQRVREVHALAVPACNDQRYRVDVTATAAAIATSLATPGGPGGAFWVWAKGRGHP